MGKVIYIASKNTGKIKEYRNALEKYGFEIHSLLDLNLNDVEETGETFFDNAFIKAHNLFKIVNKPVIADDSGLIVNSLPNELGIKSKRFSPSHTDDDNIDLLLHKLDGIVDRSAYFSTVICLYINNADIRYYEGITNGEICLSRVGNKGFGYDPIFKAFGTNKTYGELDLEEKQKLSHRGKAIDQLLKDILYENIDF